MKNRLKNLLNTGDRIELIIEDNGGTPVTLVTSLEALIDSDKLVIQANEDSARYWLRSNAPIRLVTSKDSAGILEMNGRIIESIRTDNHSVLVVELMADVQQTQRRQYYRLPILRDVRLGNSGEGYFNGFTQNISAGGLRCVLPTRLRSGAGITVKLELNQELFELKGEVLDAVDFDEEAQRYILRIRFTDTTEKDRSRLLAYIFNEQSRRKKRQTD